MLDNGNKDISTTTFVAFEENDYETLLQNIFTATAAADLTTKHVEI